MQVGFYFCFFLNCRIKTHLQVVTTKPTHCKILVKTVNTVLRVIT